jgi:RHS repeat-associated protein
MTITRDPATGFVSGATLGTVTETRTYNAFGEEQSYSSSAGSTPVYSVDYGTRDALGRIVSETETVQGETHVFGYSYDAQDRLTDVTRDGAATSHYEYDANGNRTVAPGLTASPVYDNQDRLLSYGNCTYGYKADGSLQTKTCPEGTTTYDYDAFGNLRHVTLANGTNIDYVIDGQNRRIGKKVNGALVESFLYRNQLQPAVWLNADGSVKATFVYRSDANVPEYMVQGGSVYRLITDDGGTVRAVVNASTGSVVERIDLDEFGNVLADSAPGFQPFGFAGGMRDLEVGLTRFGARDFDPLSGRWAEVEPLRFAGGSWNLFVYSGQDPINNIDSNGLKYRRKVRRKIRWPVRKPCDQTRYPGCTRAEFRFKTTSCTKRTTGLYGFDVNIEFDFLSEFSTAPSDSTSDKGKNLGDHESHHVDDLDRGTTPKKLEKAAPSEGFPDVGSCVAGMNAVQDCVNDYLKTISDRTHKRWDNHP